MELPVNILRDFQMKTWSWWANNIEPGYKLCRCAGWPGSILVAKANRIQFQQYKGWDFSKCFSQKTYTIKNSKIKRKRLQCPKTLPVLHLCHSETDNELSENGRWTSPIRKFSSFKVKNKSTACSTNTRLSGAIILLKNLSSNRGITPKLLLSELCPLSCHCTMSWWASIPSLVLIS